MNKKLLTVLSIAAFAITSIFATTGSSGDTFSSELKSTVDPISYTLQLKYTEAGNRKDALVSSEGTTNIAMDITNGDETGYFAIVASTGNLNQTVNFATELQFEAFSGTYDNGSTYTSTSIPTIKPNSIAIKANSVGDFQTLNGNTISYAIPAGPQDIVQSVATFKLNIPADTAAPAGDYSSTVTINITTTV